MAYKDTSSQQQVQMREYVEAAQERFSTFRDNKENMAFAGLAIFLGATATAIVSNDWPPRFAENKPWLIIISYTILWFFIAFYLRYQLRHRRWAAFRVAGCDWLLAEWLPDSPEAMKNEDKEPIRRSNPKKSILLFDIFWPLKSSVVAIDPTLHVYPNEIENAWLHAADRGTDALLHERIIHLAGWLGYLAVIAKTIL